VMLQLRLAAGEAGVFAYDAAYARFQDVAGFRAEAGLARRLGYLGKSCIHPSQVAHANEVFRPTDEEISHARRVAAAADEAQARDVGAYTVDGEMVDAPFVLRARTVLAAAKRLGLG
jgi:citrate lyase subunit beta / citryl-CoA lyase